MPNWSDNSTTIYFNEKSKWMDIEDIRKAYTFEKWYKTDATDEVHPFLVDRRMRHVSKADLARVYRMVFGVRYNKIEKSHVGKRFYFVGIKGTRRGKKSAIVVENRDMLMWVLSKCRFATKNKFFRDGALEAIQQWFFDTVGIFDKDMVCDWRDYSIRIIGTKWSFQLEGDYQDDYQLSFMSQTAWSPPEEFMQTIADDYGVEVGSSAEIEGEGWIHSDDCLAEWDENDDCKYDYDRDMCVPDYIENTFLPSNPGGK